MDGVTIAMYDPDRKRGIETLEALLRSPDMAARHKEIEMNLKQLREELTKSVANGNDPRVPGEGMVDMSEQAAKNLG